MSLFDDMQHSVTIFIPTVTQDSSGGEVITYTTVRAANVGCLICGGDATQRDEFSQSQRTRATHTIAFPDGGMNVQPGDQIVDNNSGSIYLYTGGKAQQGYGGIDNFTIISVTELV